MEGTYKLDVAVHKRDGYPYDYHRLLYTFRVKSRSKEVGIYRPRHTWAFSAEISRLEPGSGSSVDANDLRCSFRYAQGSCRFPKPRILSRASRQAHRTVVFTNGVFDLLHPGHVRYLEDARREGDALIVAVNSDRSVRAIKGPMRPVNPEGERAEVVAALACVDAVVIFDEETPQQIISRLQPDVLAKGADWAMDAIVGRETVEQRGGRVVRIPLAEGYCNVGDNKEDTGALGFLLQALRSTECLPRHRSICRRYSRPPRLGREWIRLRRTCAACRHRRRPCMSRRDRAIARMPCASSSSPGTRTWIEFCIDTRFFLAALEGASASALEDAVKPFPSLQIDPYRAIAPHFGVASARAAALHAIANGSATVVVRLCRRASDAAQRARQPRSRGDSNSGMEWTSTRWRSATCLPTRASTREDPVDEHGEFCVRGGIVDYFPAGADNPITGRVRRRDDRVNSQVRPVYPAINRNARIKRRWCR